MHCDDPFQPLLSTDLGIALAREHPADRPRPAQPSGDANHLDLAVDGPLAGVGVGVGEVGRAAEHGHGEAGAPDRLTDAIEIGRFEAGEEPFVHLQPVGVERPGHLDPVEDRHRPLAGDLVEVALGKGGDLQRHCGSLPPGWSGFRSRMQSVSGDGRCTRPVTPSAADRVPRRALASVDKSPVQNTR